MRILRGALFQTLRGLATVLAVAISWDLVQGAVCTRDCSFFASTGFLLANLYLLLPLLFFFTLLFEFINDRRK